MKTELSKVPQASGAQGSRAKSWATPAAAGESKARRHRRTSILCPGRRKQTHTPSREIFLTLRAASASPVAPSCPQDKTQPPSTWV